MEIPESLQVDLAEIDLGDAVKFSNAVVPEGVKPVINDRDFTIAAVSAPKVATDDEPSAEGEAAEGEEGAEGEDAEGGDEAKSEE